MKGARVKAGQSPAELYKGVLCTAKKTLFLAVHNTPLLYRRGEEKRSTYFLTNGDFGTDE